MFVRNSRYCTGKAQSFILSGDNGSVLCMAKNTVPCSPWLDELCRVGFLVILVSVLFLYLKHCYIARKIRKYWRRVAVTNLAYRALGSRDGGALCIDELEVLQC